MCSRTRTARELGSKCQSPTTPDIEYQPATNMTGIKLTTLNHIYNIMTRVLFSN